MAICVNIKLIQPERKRSGPIFRVWPEKDGEVFERGYDQIVEGMVEMQMRVDELKNLFEERLIPYSVNLDWTTETTW